MAIYGRKCSVCGKRFYEGYYVESGEYYCSEECLHSRYSHDLYMQMVDHDVAYWTDWYDSEDIDAEEEIDTEEPVIDLIEVKRYKLIGVYEAEIRYRRYVIDVVEEIDRDGDKVLEAWLSRKGYAYKDHMIGCLEDVTPLWEFLELVKASLPEYTMRYDMTHE